MAIKSIEKLHKKGGKVDIDLTGPDGNAYCLLGIASKTARKLGYSESKKADILKRMMESDYENLINVFDSEFGEYFDLYQ